MSCSTHPTTVYARRWREKNPEKFAELNRNQRWRGILRKWGMTQDDYEALLAAQDGVCAICRGGPVGNKRYLGIDHDHETGKRRGLLCDKCNRALGGFNDDPDALRRAADYLDRYA